MKEHLLNLWIRRLVHKNMVLILIWMSSLPYSVSFIIWPKYQNDWTNCSFDVLNVNSGKEELIILERCWGLITMQTVFWGLHTMSVVWAHNDSLANNTYAAGPVKSTVDYIIVWQEDKAKVRNVKVIPNEECVPKHKLLVMDMQFSTRKRRRKKFQPRVRVWKLKEEKTWRIPKHGQR